MWETIRTIRGMSKTDLHWSKFPLKPIGKTNFCRKRTPIILTPTATFYRLNMLFKTRKLQFIIPISIDSIVTRRSTGLNWHFELVSLNAAIAV